MVFAYGYDMALRFNFDRLGWTYITLSIVWTVLLISGLVFLFINRELPFLRMRNIPLSISAVATLHVYWCLCMTAYVLNGNFPCATEFWIMSTYLPLGIAMYQASNTQLLHVACLQRKFTDSKYTDLEKKRANPQIRGWRKLLATWTSYSATKKATTCITIGMIAQVICTTTIFLISKKFHTGWGATGHSVGKMACRRGWEWWPSIVWQFTWSWLYAPYILWKLRGIEDVHCWRLQTVLCSIAGLPASPMWLIGLYVPQFDKINRYFVPPLWFSPCIVLMEASVVFIACWQILKTRKLKQSTLQIIEEWEKKQKKSNSIGSDSTKAGTRSIVSHNVSMNSTTNSRRGEMYTMNALETALQTNSTPLLLFAALKDFSGENISFLNHVRNWKAKWKPPVTRYGLLRKPDVKYVEGEALRRQQFKSAMEIYHSFVSMQHSSFPINLSSAHHKELETIFEGANASIKFNCPDNAATPYNSSWSSKNSLDLEASLGADQISVVSAAINKSTEAIIPFPERIGFSFGQNIKLIDRQQVPSHTAIPEAFGPEIFSNAEESIKYMVLTNTWPKFVLAGYATNMPKNSVLKDLKERISSWVDACVESWVRSTGTAS